MLSRSLPVILLLCCPLLAEAQEPTDVRLQRLERSLKEIKSALKKERAARLGLKEELELKALMREAEEEAASGEQEESQRASTQRLGQSRLNAFNPRLTAIGNLLGRVATRSVEKPNDDRFSLTELELDLRADVDPYSKAVAILSFEEDGQGGYSAGVEEGYITLEMLPYNFGAKLGLHRIPFGQINRLHGHDLPWSTRPLPVEDFFGDEGFADAGVNLNWISPTMGPITLTFEGALLSGEGPNILVTKQPAVAGQDPAIQDPDENAWRGRVEAFTQVSPDIFLILGSNLLFGYNGTGRSRQTVFWGGDLLLKWLPNQLHSIVLMAELYYLDKDVDGPVGVQTEHAWGGFSALQVQVLQRFYLGARYDYSTYDEETENSDHYKIAGYVSGYTTEFLRFRVGYEHHERELTSGVRKKGFGTLFFQVTFVFGSHPVEPFWFNK